MSDHYYELPVDVKRKSEVVQDRIGLIIIAVVIAVITFLLFLLSVNTGLILAKGASALPDVRLLEEWRPSESTRIFDREGTLIANISGDEDRVVVPLEEISPNVQRAVMAIEDSRFFEHGGIDIRGTLRAATQNLKGGDIQGGSTLTQQLVKNLFLTPERTIKRKIAEAVLATRVEKHYSKKKILEMYLNQVYWGNQSYGIEKAARRYFEKPASELTVGESALLAGLLKAPEGLSPYNYPDAAKHRQLVVLAKMEEHGYITRKQRIEAARQEITLNARIPKPSKHPYFVAHVIQELEDKYGRDVIRRGGLEVYTTMNREIQTAAEQALIKGVTSKPDYTNVTNGALVSMDVETGEILALVGGVDFEKSQFNNATMARRAVGSTFKPFVYLTGFRTGLITPNSMISDRPVSYPSGGGTWSPQNWDGKFMGPMTIRKALTLSRNTPTVQIGMKLGIAAVTETAELAGIDSPIDQNSSSLLGSSGVSPLELTTGYATFARGGIMIEPTVIKRLEDNRGNEIEVPREAPKRVFDPDPVANLVSILVDVVEKGTGRSARLEGRQVAGKTGTTDKVRDIWFVGFTPDMVTTVWMGNEKYTPLRGVFSFNAAEVWHEFAEKYYQIRNIPPTTFPDPQPILVKKSVITKDEDSSDDVPLPPAGDNVINDDSRRRAGTSIFDVFSDPPEQAAVSEPASNADRPLAPIVDTAGNQPPQPAKPKPTAGTRPNTANPKPAQPPVQPLPRRLEPVAPATGNENRQTERPENYIGPPLPP